MKEIRIEQYNLKNGAIRYKFQAYLGIDLLTGKRLNTTRRGFKSIREAELTYLRLVDNPELTTNQKHTCKFIIYGLSNMKKMFVKAPIIKLQLFSDCTYCQYLVKLKWIKLHLSWSKS